MLKSRLFAVIPITLLLSACFSDDDDQIDTGVSLSELSSPESGTYYLGQPFSVDFTVSGVDVSEAENVLVSFHIIDSADADELTNTDDSDAPAFEVGQYVIGEVANGSQSYTADLIVPNDLTIEGEYLLVAYVDDTQVVTNDTNLDDNASRDFDSAAQSTFGTMDIGLEFYNDFILSDLEVGNGYLLLPDLEDYDSSESAEPSNIQSDLVGFVYASKYGSDSTEGVISGTITIAGMDYTTYFWHKDDNEYSDSVPIDFTNFEESLYFGWDISLNGELVNALYDAYDDSLDENTFSLTLSVSDSTSTAEDVTTNNSISIEVPYFALAESVANSIATKSSKTSQDVRSETVTTTSDTLTVSNDYSQTYGDDSAVAIDIDFSNEIYLDGSSGTASIDASGDFDLTVFDTSATLLGTTFSAEVIASELTADYDVEVEVLENSVFSKSDDSADYLDESWDESWDEDVTLFEEDLTVVIVTLTVKAGIEGSIGFGTELSFDEGVINATGTVVSASLDVTASADLDAVITTVGVEADFTIIEDDFDVVAEVDLSEAVSDSKMTMSLDVTNELLAIEGDFYAYATYEKFKWCCKFKTKEYTVTIYDTDALYDKTWTMISESKTFDF